MHVNQLTLLKYLYLNNLSFQLFHTDESIQVFALSFWIRAEQHQNKSNIKKNDKKDAQANSNDPINNNMKYKLEIWTRYSLNN